MLSLSLSHNPLPSLSLCLSLSLSLSLSLDRFPFKNCDLGSNKHVPSPVVNPISPLPNIQTEVPPRSHTYTQTYCDPPWHTMAISLDNAISHQITIRVYISMGNLILLDAKQVISLISLHVSTIISVVIYTLVFTCDTAFDIGSDIDYDTFSNIIPYIACAMSFSHHL